MSDKQINGRLAGSLIAVARHLVKLEEEVRDINWRACYRSDLIVEMGSAITHCRKLMDELKSADRRLRIEAAEKHEAENNPVIRQVK